MSKQKIKDKEEIKVVSGLILLDTIDLKQTVIKIGGYI